MTTNTKLLEVVQSIKSGKITSAAGIIKLEEMLIENIREEVAKSNGNKKPLQVVKEVVKSGDEIEIYRKCHEFTYKGKEYKGFLEGHYIVASDDDFGYEKEEKNPFNISPFFESEENCDREFKIDIKDLKAFIKIHSKEDSPYGKGKEPYILTDGEFKIGFNPKFLLNVLAFTDSNTIKVSKSIEPAFCSSEDKSKIALVLPIKLK